MHRVSKAYLERDLPAVQAFVVNECGADCDLPTARRLCQEFEAWNKKVGGCRWHSITTGFVMWTRNRLQRDGAFDVADGGVIHDDRLCCDLHVFFLFLEETDEMFANLKNEKSKLVYQESRSRVFRTAQVLTPIDAVAQRVAPER